MGGYEGWTPLLLAVYEDYMEVARELIAHGAEINHQANLGQSALMVATENGERETVAFLLQYGADVTLTAEDGSTTFTLAEQYELTDIAELLRHVGSA